MYSSGVEDKSSTCLERNQRYGKKDKGQCSSLIEICACVKARACESIISAFTCPMVLPVQAGRGFGVLSQNASHGHIKGYPKPLAIPQVSEIYSKHYADLMNSVG